MNDTRSAATLPTDRRPWWTTEGRAAHPFRTRVAATLGVIALLHVAGVGLLGSGIASDAASPVTLGLAAFAYLRGLVHSFDFDHISMIDNSTRKFVAEGRRPASVGLAFSLGHSTVVLLTGLLVIAGAGVVRVALDDRSTVAATLGVIGLSVSGGYLLVVALSNLVGFSAAWRLRRALAQNPGLEVAPDALSPRGPAARLLTAPLRRVRHPRHIYLVGFLFSLGFDTSSQIGLLMLTGAAALAGAPPLSLLALPFLFAAAMTLSDTGNGLLMLRLHSAAADDPARKITFNLVITAVSVVSALVVAVLAVASLADQLGVRVGLVAALAALDTTYAGYLLVALIAAIGSVAWMRWRRSRACP